MYWQSVQKNFLQEVRRGLWRCLFNRIRQCESLGTWDGQQAVPTSLFCVNAKGNWIVQHWYTLDMKTCMTSHSQPKIFTEDLLVRDALLRHDGKVTRVFFYQQCYPLFKSIYDNYYTDCACVKEFVDEIYVLALAPSKTTGKCQLENFRGESTLTSWLKTACLYYCYNKYELKERMPKYELFRPSKMMKMKSQLIEQMLFTALMI